MSQKHRSSIGTTVGVPPKSNCAPKWCWQKFS